MPDKKQNEKKINARIIHKHDIEANWIKAINFIPKKAEIIVYDADSVYDYPRFKIGDGVNNVTNLPFIVDRIMDEILNSMSSLMMPKPVCITLYGSDSWILVKDNIYYQNITDQLNGKITEYSKVDIQPTPEQLNVFHKKDVAFTTVNDNGTVYVYAIGIKPEQDYNDIQVTITEVYTDA